MTSIDLTLEEKTEDGDTALTLAAEANRLENVKMLLQHGASPHNTNSRNESPLLIGSKRTQNHSQHLAYSGSFLKLLWPSNGCQIYVDNRGRGFGLVWIEK